MTPSDVRSRVKEALGAWSSQRSLWLAAVIVCGFLAYYLDATRAKPDDSGKTEDPASAATSIPAGFVLVPIEIANYESLDSILGKFGVVDLYVPSEDPTLRPRMVARKVRILRAPLNPSRFAVLVSEADSPRLVTHPGPFTVVVQNPNSSGTGFVNSPNESDKKGSTRRPRKRSRIQVEVVENEAG